MDRYMIHFFDRLDVCILVREWAGADDVAALQEAERLSTSHAIEVWQGERRVARVNRHNASLRTAQRTPL